ncbi:hypothetical protein [Streptomyces noursei]|uniref:hypothetical protein n=1 Tax=Streptomyces noursei TaxID=1971 RepID=UPI0016721257|nr:hypothetical protein [Streptomyces noursei]MCZ1021027.1 hypothetical protein [Streptomyces noursei]GGX52040.1 hypothetical protein GCM10010341_86840 [Streptomyces noursei]
MHPGHGRQCARGGLPGAWRRPANLPGPADVLAACLADEHEGIRITAAIRLALRDDPRGAEVLRDCDAADQSSPYHWDLLDVWRRQTLNTTD